MNLTALRSYSITQIVIAMMALSLIFSAIAAALISSNRYYHTMSSYTNDKYLPQLLGRIEGEIHSELNGLIGMSRAMGQNTYIKQWMVTGQDEAQLTQVQQSLEAVRQYSGAMRAFVVAKDGYKYYTAKHGLREIINPATDPWFDEFLASGKDYAISLGITSQDTVRAYINTRMNHNGSAIGATGLSFEMTQFEQMLKKHQLEDGGQLFLIDNKGKIALHMDQQMLGKNLNQLSGLSDLASDIINNQDYLNQQRDIQGEEHFIASLKMPDINFSIVALLPTKSFTDEMFSNAVSTMLFNLFIALVFLAIMIMLIRMISRAISDISETLYTISANNDLTVRLDQSGTKEVVKIAKAYNNMAENFHKVLSNLSNHSITLSQNSQSLQKITADMSTGAQTQVFETERIMTEVAQLQLTDDDIKHQVNDAQQVTQNTQNKSHQGKAAVEQTRQAINQLNHELNASTDVIAKLEQDTDKIAGILAVISAIAEQTNLLALNAAIEAARAGEQGRGFAVVADEVRALAGKTQNSTGDIQAMVATITDGVEKTVTNMRQTANLAIDCVDKSEQVTDLINEINSEIDTINGLTNNINEAVANRGSATTEIKQQTTDINHIANQSNDNTVQSQDTTQALHQLALQLNQTVSQFKL